MCLLMFQYVLPDVPDKLRPLCVRLSVIKVTSTTTIYIIINIIDRFLGILKQHIMNNGFHALVICTIHFHQFV